MLIGWLHPPLGCIRRTGNAGGCTRGAAAPLVGGAARLWRRGGNPPAPAFPPQGETGKGVFKFLAAAGHYSLLTPESAVSAFPPQVLVTTSKPEFPCCFASWDVRTRCVRSAAGWP